MPEIILSDYFYGDQSEEFFSDTQMGYITNAEAGHGLLRIGGSLAPFSNTISRDTELYRLMSTTSGEN